jgi:uncharacterized protein YjhX (UPF0386 family)
MARATLDGVIETVRYRDGKISLVRVHERRGAAFGDHVLLDREALLQRLKAGKRFYTGQRKPYWANSFEIQKPVLLLRHNGEEIIATHPDATQDDLELPLF